ncbi:hypothetical protein [Sulfurimonas sp.]|jgi:hypothetical protein|uniref:hypothetical protein n=1 Tax=Sulfurimonas sp. TaxID=2022749 RepID=UPI002A363B05|nr:hypothetical protein [Sulfurimonas sp.]MDY0123140.1 hypothetical protein [Sulfurimonas sp.]
MSYWNYRIILKEDKRLKAKLYQIHEVYYSKKGKIKGWTENPVAPYGETKKELKKELKYFQNALKHPILKEKKKGKKTILVEKKKI